MPPARLAHGASPSLRSHCYRHLCHFVDIPADELPGRLAERRSPVVERFADQRDCGVRHGVGMGQPLDRRATRDLESAADRRPIPDLAQFLGGEKAGDQDVRDRQIELLRRASGSTGAIRLYPRGAREQRSKHARLIEALGEVAIDRSADAHKRGAMRVADDAVLGDRQIPVGRAYPRNLPSNGEPAATAVIRLCPQQNAPDAGPPTP
jgi:hypothetical protein